MAVVLDNSPGERVLLYGADGATLRKAVVDSSGRLVTVGPGVGGAVTVTATDLDIRNLTKTLDELYAVLRTDAGAAYDARQVLGNDGTTDRRILTTTAGLLRQTRHFTQTLTSTYETVVGQHAVTSRWSYTVPASRIAYLEYIYAEISATTTAGASTIYLELTRSGSGGSRLFRFESIVGGNGIVNRPVSVSLAAGDKVEAFTINSEAINREFHVVGYFREITL